MKKAALRKSIYLFLALILGFAVSGCGGGGGGGGAATTTTTTTTGGGTARTFTIAGTMNGITALAREAGREVEAPVANTTIVAYVLGDANHTALNAVATTDANGNFTITVNIGSVANADIVVEALVGGAAAGSASNPKIALENASANITGQIGNDASTAEAELWSANTSESLASTIAPIVDMFEEQGLTMSSVRSVIATSARGQQLVSTMKTVVSGCAASTGSEKTNCIIQAIDDRLAEIADSQVSTLVSNLQHEYVSDRVNTTAASTADKLKFQVPSASYDTLNAIVAMYGEGSQYSADLSIDTMINSADYAREFVAKLTPAATAFNSNLPGVARSLAVKEKVLYSLKTDSFVYTAVSSQFLYLRNSYQELVSLQAAEAQTRVASADLVKVIRAYDALRNEISRIFYENASVTYATGWQMGDGLIYMLKMLGGTSGGNSSMQGILDDWVPAYAATDFRDQMHILFDPLDMTDRVKTQYFMELAHDLGDSDGTRAGILTVLNNYVAAGKLNQATVTEVMRLYDKYSGGMDCQTITADRELFVGSNCITRTEIVDVLELHFEKNLPKVEAVLAAIQNIAKNPTTDTATVALAQEQLSAIYSGMKSGTAAKAEIDAVLDKAGITKELFWLAMNVEPYI